jgi:hypothetical protein
MAIDRRQLGSSRQWLLFGGLLVALAVVLWMRGGGTEPEPANAGPRTSNTQGRTAGRAQDLDVRLEDLTAERAQPAEIERNPFRFEARRRRPAAQPPPRRAPAPEEVSPAVPAGPPQPAPIPLKFIGIIESAGAGRMAALTDGKHVFHGRAGDIIEGRYRIIRIGVESIVLERVDGGTQQTIRMSGS